MKPFEIDSIFRVKSVAPHADRITDAYEVPNYRDGLFAGFALGHYAKGLALVDLDNLDSALDEVTIL